MAKQGTRKGSGIAGNYTQCWPAVLWVAREIPLRTTALNNIRCGNNAPPARCLARNKTCNYCSSMGNWQSNCPVLRRDAFLPPPQDP
ncbi:uncharacterized protein VP01_6094g1, partial [Puccinia sorghi]